MYGVRTIRFRSLAVASVWLTIACGSVTAQNDADSLTGTWTAHAGGFGFRIAIRGAQCSIDGCLVIAASGTYTQDVTGATGKFTVDVSYFQYISTVTLYFQDTTTMRSRYQERFEGNIVSSTRMDGVIQLIRDAPLSPFHLAQGTAFSFARQ
jgi:hypothetical protein